MSKPCAICRTYTYHKPCSAGHEIRCKDCAKKGKHGTECSKYNLSNSSSPYIVNRKYIDGFEFMSMFQTKFCNVSKYSKFTILLPNLMTEDDGDRTVTKNTFNSMIPYFDLSY
jgi:hypothetical protein